MPFSVVFVTSPLKCATFISEINNYIEKLIFKFVHRYLIDFEAKEFMKVKKTEALHY